MGRRHLRSDRYKCPDSQTVQSGTHITVTCLRIDGTHLELYLFSSLNNAKNGSFEVLYLALINSTQQVLQVLLLFSTCPFCIYTRYSTIFINSSL